MVTRESTGSDVDYAAATALHAADALLDMERATRARMLNGIAAELQQDREVLVDVADRETALGVQRLNSEFDRTIFQLRMFADVISDTDYLEPKVDEPHQTVLGETPDLRRLLVPLGPVLVFAASNFPFAFSVAGGDTAAALAAGCPVIVKTHPGHPATSKRTFDALSRALAAMDAPAGTVTAVYGLDAGRTLVEHPAVRAVSFTGSATGGRALFDAANGRADPIPFYGELAGANPVVITTAAARHRGESIARGLIDSVLLGAGQFCTKPGLIFVPNDEHGARLLDLMSADLRQRTPEPLLTEAIKSNFYSGLQSLTSLPKVTTVRGRGSVQGGFGVVPAMITVDAEHFDNRLATECFGPLTVCVRYQSTERLLALLGTLPGSLVGTLHAEPDDDAELAVLLVRRLSKAVGRLVFNGYPTGVTVNAAMTHGGPWPATTNSLHSSVGATAIRRFLRPITWQNMPPPLLPPELRAETSNRTSPSADHAATAVRLTS